MILSKLHFITKRKRNKGSVEIRCLKGGGSLWSQASLFRPVIHLYPNCFIAENFSEKYRKERASHRRKDESTNFKVALSIGILNAGYSKKNKWTWRVGRFAWGKVAVNVIANDRLIVGGRSQREKMKRWDFRSWGKRERYDRELKFSGVYKVMINNAMFQRWKNGDIRGWRCRG